MLVVLSVFVSSQMTPRSLCISETTRVGPRLSLLCHPITVEVKPLLLPVVFIIVCFSVSWFDFTAEASVPDCFFYLLGDMWLSQLINFIQQLTLMLYCPLWVPAINYGVWTNASKNKIE